MIIFPCSSARGERILRKNQDSEEQTEREFYSSLAGFVFFWWVFIGIVLIYERLISFTDNDSIGFRSNGTPFICFSLSLSLRLSPFTIYAFFDFDSILLWYVLILKFSVVNSCCEKANFTIYPVSPKRFVDSTKLLLKHSFLIRTLLQGKSEFYF